MLCRCAVLLYGTAALTCSCGGAVDNLVIPAWYGGFVPRLSRVLLQQRQRHVSCTYDGRALTCCLLASFLALLLICCLRASSPALACPPCTLLCEQVYGLPCFLLFRDGALVEGSRTEGAMSKKGLQEYLAKHGISAPAKV